MKTKQPIRIIQTTNRTFVITGDEVPVFFKYQIKGARIFEEIDIELQLKMPSKVRSLRLREYPSYDEAVATIKLFKGDFCE